MAINLSPSGGPPSLGRFINRDTIGEAGGLNLYAYVRNRVPNAFDYLGMFVVLPDPFARVWARPPGEIFRHPWVSNPVGAVGGFLTATAGGVTLVTAPASGPFAPLQAAAGGFLFVQGEAQFSASIANMGMLLSGDRSYQQVSNTGLLGLTNSLVNIGAGMNPQKDEFLYGSIDFGLTVGISRAAPSPQVFGQFTDPISTILDFESATEVLSTFPTDLQSVGSEAVTTSAGGAAIPPVLFPSPGSVSRPTFLVSTSPPGPHFVRPGSAAPATASGHSSVDRAPISSDTIPISEFRVHVSPVPRVYIGRPMTGGLRATQISTAGGTTFLGSAEIAEALSGIGSDPSAFADELKRRMEEEISR